jgi:DNA-binding CsgD family transcriptional regulator
VTLAEPKFIDRRRECDLLDRLVDDVLAGESRVLVLRGEAGVGKSALLAYLADRVEGWQIARAVGVESEMELPYSALHQLCAPLLDRLDRLPVPQREALATVFGRSEGVAPNGFLVGLATLTLLADVAEQQPLVCIVDDAQWLDHASGLVLVFLARRLLAERIALICALRSGVGDSMLSGLPELAIEGLDDRNARTLLLDNVHGALDPDVCDQIIAESHGNPLALLELSRTWDAVGFAGGFGSREGRAVTGKVERSYVERLRQLPADAQLLVLAAAAEPVGDPRLLRRAAATLGVDMAAADPAVDAGLLRIGARVEFAHPLVRSAAYGSASADDRHAVHGALAGATDAETDPDRRAWHRARASSGPDEEVAAELERSAGRAQARGGLAAAAAFLENAVVLTVDRERRAGRALAAAEANLQAGAFDAALRLIATAKSASLDGSQQARVDLVRGQVVLASGDPVEGAQLLLRAAKQFEASNMDLARDTYLAAWGAALVASHHPAGDAALLEICRGVNALPPPPGAPRPRDLLLEGLALLVTDGRAAAAPTLQRAAKALTRISVEDVLRFGLVAFAPSTLVWDYESNAAVDERRVQLAREAGALMQLPILLQQAAITRLRSGDLGGAASLVAESDSVALTTGSQLAPYALVWLRALQGAEKEATTVITRAIERTEGAQALASHAHHAAALLYNGLARYEEAASSAQLAVGNASNPWYATWALPELVEAASRIGNESLARDAFERLTEATQPANTDFALGIEARTRAIVTDGRAAETLYQEAIDRLSRTPLRPELSRAQLLYGEWLRREGRRVDARTQLRTAHDMFVEIGMEAFADRTRRELQATGEKVRKRVDETRGQLTPQEDQIARLARDGLSNPEIGARLFLSSRTVEWHLRKVFMKLGISSRRQLEAALTEAAVTNTGS